jgi:hypothetical protein
VDSQAFLIDALAQLGVQARQAVGMLDEGIDLVVEPGETPVRVKRRALVTDDVTRRLLAERQGSPDSVLLVVGDPGD